MKRILIFSLAYYPKHVGGAEVAIKEITDRCSPDEYEFHMVTNRFDSNLPRVSKEGNVTVHRIGITRKNPQMGDLRQFPLVLNKALFQFFAAWKAAQLHRVYQFDATWAMMAHSCGVPAALFKITHPQIPFVLTLQEGDPIQYIERKMRPVWPLFILAFTRADIIQAISQFLACWARARKATCPVVVVPNAVDTALFMRNPSADELDTIRTMLGKRVGEIWLVTTSRLVQKNAIDDVIKALSHLPERVHFLIYGSGPDELQLRRLVSTCGVEQRVHWGGFLKHEDMPKYLRACDIFIRPSRSEGMGNSFIEAMAAGLPVIATQEGGIADFLFDAKRNPDMPTTGWAVNPDSPQDIVVAVENIINHPEQVADVTQNAKKLVMSQYDWNIVTQNMKEKVFGPVFKESA